MAALSLLVAVSALAFVMTMAIARDSVAGEPEPLPAEVSPAHERVEPLVREARALLEAGKPQEAYALLEEAFLQEPEDPSVNFYMGRAAYAAGEYSKAATAFERILDKQPDLMRVHLELARSLYMLQDYERAQEHFQRVRESEPPQPVQENIDRFLAAIDRAQQKHLLLGRLAVTYGSDSNPAIAPTREVIDTVLGEVRLDPDVFEEADGFRSTSAFLKHVWKTPAEPMEWRTTFSSYQTWYESADEQDFNYYSVESGPGATFGAWDVELLATFNALEKDNEMYQKGHGGELNIAYAVNPRVMVGVSGRREMKKVHYDRNLDAVNWAFAVRPVFRLGAEGRTQLFTEFRYEREYPQEGAEYRSRRRDNWNELKDSYIEQSASLRLSHQWRWGLRPYLGYTFRETEYSVRTQTFDVPRKDRSFVYTAGVTKELPWRMSVDLAHERTYTYSTVELHEYRRHRTMLTLAKDF